jgi:dihydrofolate reductase
MRKIRIFEHISLDGVIEHGQEYAYGAWTVPYRPGWAAPSWRHRAGASICRLAAAPTISGPASAEGRVRCGYLNAATKYVATHRPDSLEWGPVGNLGADVMEGVRRVKSTDGPDLIVWGSSTLTSVLLGQGLVDEVVLIVYPVLLGRGKRFFSDSVDARELALVSTKATPTGVLLNTYRYVGSLRTESLADAKG